MFRPIGLDYTIMFPGTNGGANWGGASYDPSANLLFVNSMDVAALVKMTKRPEGSVIPYRSLGRGSQSSRFWDSRRGESLVPDERGRRARHGLHCPSLGGLKPSPLGDGFRERAAG